MSKDPQQKKIELLENEIAELKEKIKAGNLEFENIAEGSRKNFLDDVIKESLKESEREKEQILNSLVERVCYIDLDYNIKWINKAGLKAIPDNKKIENIIGNPCYQVYHNTDKPCEGCPVTGTIKTGWPWKEEISNSKGETFLISSQPVLDENGKIKGVIEVMLDISMRKEMENALERSQKRSKALLNAIPDLLVVFNDNGLFIDYHESTEFELFQSENAVEGRHLTEIMPEHLASTIIKNTGTLHNEGSVRTFEYNHASTGENKYFECKVVKSGIHENACIIRDISSRKSKENDYYFKSFHDVLTGLYNRAYFDEELKRLELNRNAIPTSVLIVDVNSLKLTNDAFGHAFGDQLLKKVSEILSANCRKSDVIARTGGDEFAILLPGSTLSRAEKLASNIITACNESVYDDIFSRPSVSIGCAAKTSQEESLIDAVHKADELMYKMKLQNRGNHLEQLFADIIETAQTRGYETHRHISNLITINKLFSKKLNLSATTAEKLNNLAKLHDIGKIRIPSKILTKDGMLTDEEYNTIKQHSIIGYRIVKAIPEFSSIAELILYHHECWDGSGYPSGLKEKNIPIESRIFSILDSFDSMTHDTPYKKGKSFDEAIDEIRKYSGRQYDPEIARTFTDFLKEENLESILS